MQGTAGRDPEFHIRPLLFQITSLPCPAIHYSDDDDYSGSGSDNEQSHHHDEENFDDDIIIMAKIMVRMTMTVTIRPLLFQITSSASHGWRLKGDRRKLRRFDPGKEN